MHLNVDKSNLHQLGLNSVALYCIGCTSNPYARGNGLLRVSSVSDLSNRTMTNLTQDIFSNENKFKDYIQINEYINPCSPCPFGAICEEGQVRPRPNYWGFKGLDKLTFHACPMGYCCNGIDIPCSTIESCAPFRSGRLCGVCLPGFSESLLSRKCVPNDNCNDKWIWPAMILLALAYLLWFMTRRQLVSHLKSLCNIVLKYRWKHRNIVTTIDTFGQNVKSENQSVEKGYFEIIIHFVNVIGLLQVSVEFHSKNSGIISKIDKLVKQYVDIDIHQISNHEICPFPGVDASFKVLLKPTFTLLMVVIWGMLFASSSLFKTICTQKKHTRMFNFSLTLKNTLLKAYVDMMKFSFSGVAGATFLYLTCTEIDGIYYWEYNGNIKCISTWQWVVIGFSILYTLPFPIMTVQGIRLLGSGCIPYWQFMLGMCFPLPYLLFWHVFYSKVIYENKENQSKYFEQITSHNKQRRAILSSLVAPYKSKYSFWEGIIQLRKLVYNIFFLISNDIYRLILCSAAAIIFQLMHLKYSPFRHQEANSVETLSLTLICFSAFINSIKSVFPVLGIWVEQNSPTEQLLQIMNRVNQLLIFILLLYILVLEMHILIKNEKAKLKKK